jgi:hypothetical protein
MRDVRITTFVVRVTQDPAGGLSGIIERVSDGFKERLPRDLDTVGTVIRRLLPAPPPREPSIQPSAKKEEPE